MAMFPNTLALAGWCRGREWRRLRKTRGSTIRLGSKGKLRGFNMGSRLVVQWGLMAAHLRMLKKIIMEITPKQKLMEAYYLYLSFLRPHLFPLC
ncbi:hypothetical protein V6N13_021798 [Hibiscus sabdariffa]|uniref:Uncharacterized protein n=1 Tax=Hibiscus sabdariffa TaxID=183260 RepID=A0ABR2CPR0_9ROSI